MANINCGRNCPGDLDGMNYYIKLPFLKRFMIGYCYRCWWVGIRRVKAPVEHSSDEN